MIAHCLTVFGIGFGAGCLCGAVLMGFMIFRDEERRK